MPSDSVTYRAAGLPQKPETITEISGTRTGKRLGLQWTLPLENGGSPIIVYTLALVQENLQDEIVYYGSALETVIDDLVAGKIYTYHVKATNLVGDSEWSNQFTFKNVAPPTEPLKLNIIQFDDILVSLEWT